MTFPSFTTGEVLTAADMNAVGLWLVKTQTIGTAVATVTVNDAFSSAYDNYLITIQGGVGSVSNQVMTMKLGSTTTGYYYSLLYAAYNSTPLATGLANAGDWTYTGILDTNGLRAHVTLLSPFLNKVTTIHCANANSTQWGGVMNGLLNNTTSYTSFIVGTSGGTMTGGTISVYGYKKG